MTIRTLKLAGLLGCSLLLPTLAAVAQTPPTAPNDPFPAAQAQTGGNSGDSKSTARRHSAGQQGQAGGGVFLQRANGLYADFNALTPKEREFQDQRVNLHLDNVPIQQAFEKLFTQTGKGSDVYQLDIDGDVPTDRRVSIRADDVRFATALDLLCEAGGVHYRVENREGKLHYHVGKTVQPSSALSVSLRNTFKLPQGTQFQPVPLEKLNVLADPAGNGLAYRFLAGERRATFTCPNCKNQVTVIRRVQEPECPKCGRTFRSDWQFCPYDGTRRPATVATDWKYCPICGKRVEIEKSGAVQENKIPVLGDIPLIGELFRPPARRDAKPNEEERPDPNQLRDPLHGPKPDAGQPRDPFRSPNPDPNSADS